VGLPDIVLVVSDLEPPTPAPCTLALHDALPILPSSKLPRICRVMAPYIIAWASLPMAILPSGINTNAEGKIAMGKLAQAMMYGRSEEHTSELQSRENLVCRLLLDKKTAGWCDVH